MKGEYPSTENTGKDEEREYSEGVGGVGRRAAAHRSNQKVAYGADNAAGEQHYCRAPIDVAKGTLLPACARYGAFGVYVGMRI